MTPLTTRRLFLLAVGLLLWVPHLSAQIFVESHTTVVKDQLFPACVTEMEDPSTIIEYAGVDAFCGIADPDIIRATWTCSGKPSAVCRPSGLMFVAPGASYRVVAEHDLFLPFDAINKEFFDPLDYAADGIKQFPDFGTRSPRNDGVESTSNDKSLLVAQTFETIFTPVKLTPTGADLIPKQTVGFTANQPVTWHLDANQPGRIIASTATTATYQAPVPISEQQTVQLGACAKTVAHTDICAVPDITIEPIFVTIETPAHTEVLPGRDQDLNARVDPSNASQEVRWSIDPPSTAGTIDTSTGLFTALNVLDTTDVTVKACSTLDTTRCSTIIMTVPLATVETTAFPNPFLAVPDSKTRVTAFVSGPLDPANRAVSFSLAGLLTPPLGTAPAGVLNIVDDQTADFKVTQAATGFGSFTVHACVSENLIRNISICAPDLPVVYLPPVKIASLNVSTFNSGESTAVTITGTGFSANPTVTFQDPSLSFQRISIDASGTTLVGNIIIQPLTAAETQNLSVASGFPKTTNPPPSGSSPISVQPVTIITSVTPASAALLDGQSQQFTAAVTCVTAGNHACTVSQAVTCSVSPAVGTMGSSTCLYTAPATIPTQQNLTGQACSVFGNVCKTFPITLLPVTVTVVPANATLTGGQNQQFQATVSNAPGNNQGVTWSISPVVGSISTAGLYTAPGLIANAQALTVKACSVVDTTHCGTAQVSLVPVAVAVAPKTVTLQSGQTQPFTATVTGTANQSVNWSVSAGTGVPVGTINSAGLYTAPPPPITGPQVNTVTACSVVDPGKCDSAVVNLISTTPVGSLSPTSLTFAAQLAGTTSGTQPVTLTNIGAASLTLTSIVATGDFSVPSNTCTAPLPLNGSCIINVAFIPTATGTRAGQLTVTNNASNSPQIASLSGTGIAPAACISPGSISFGSQNVASTSPPQPVTVTSCGTAPLTINSIAAAGDFAQTNSCPSSLAVSANCVINITFTPAATGPRAGTLTVSHNAPGSPSLINLSGTGTIPIASLSPASLAFGNQNVGTTSGTQTVTLTNSGTGPLSISSIATSGDFAQSNTCGSTLAAGANCAISIAFKPTATGSRTGAVTVTDNAAGSPRSSNLSGTGTAPIANLSPASLTFGSQQVGTTSAAQTLTLTNSGTGPLSISSIATSGDFAQSNTCGSTLAAGANCAISVTFNPTATGSRTGTVTVTDNAAGSPQSSSLSGTATPPPAACLSPASLNFGLQSVTTTSAAKPVTLTNCSSAVLTISSVTTSGDYIQTNNCPVSLAANASCTINVSFRPTAAVATRTGTLSVTDNAPGSPHTTSLTGIGIPADFSFSVSGPQNIDLSVTNQATFTYNVSSTSAAGTVTVSIDNTVYNFASPYLNPTTFASSGSGTLTLLLGAGLAPGTYTITLTATGAWFQHSVTTTLTVIDSSGPPGPSGI